MLGIVDVVIPKDATEIIFTELFEGK